MKVKKGDRIKVLVDEISNSYSNRYKVGDEFEVAIATKEGDIYVDMNGETPLWLIKDEYEVIKPV